MGINIKLNNLVYPYFAVSGKGRKEEIKNFPGCFRLSVDYLVGDIAKAQESGVNKFLFFGVADYKDALGTGAYKKDGIISKAIREIKKRFPDITVITDVCLCAYTAHGHCGLIKKGTDRIDNKATLEALSDMALTHAQAGADWVAPSAMAKRQVFAIREKLDKNGFGKTKILGYSAKFASNFYGPFRNAARSAPKFGDRRSYQLDYRDKNKAFVEIDNDIKEGADMVMVKPALSYLDIIQEAKRRFSCPLAAYNVSGEYAMIKQGARLGLWKEKEAALEVITSIARAGADLIITYHAKDIARWLKKEH